MGSTEDFQNAVRDAERFAFNPQALQGVADQVQMMTARLQEVSDAPVEGVDDTGLVTATVSGGALRTVAISAHAIRDLSAEELGQACLQAIQHARQRGGQLIAETMSDMFPDLSASATADNGRAEGPDDSSYEVTQVAEALRRAARKVR
ncbi:YbaB/EbfC family nucleoid-associated protein [Micromonospora sp. KC213]|uniref:YbaB/EbfC family nucleoid-associated protein n=1 Tax=Micromonospora sp. KC213 TaxID=2530378 RepID=UPI0010454D68|nr:YbaB/EbfC family nucleoid-associated protein [Micromonospora sp. KC213]TDC41411.1 YbaB/EbfC family DNA-binding protein [Micromonospora sp. KC213]